MNPCDKGFVSGLLGGVAGTAWSQVGVNLVSIAMLAISLWLYLRGQNELEKRYD